MDPMHVECISSSPLPTRAPDDASDDSRSAILTNDEGYAEAATSTPSRLSSQPTLQEVLAQSSTMPALLSSVSGRVSDFTEKDEAFRREFRRQLFRLVMKMYAWSSARLVHDNYVSNENLERDINSLQEAETEKDQARTRLSELFSMVNRALEISRFGEF